MHGKDELAGHGISLRGSKAAYYKVRMHRGNGNYPGKEVNAWVRFQRRELAAQVGELVSEESVVSSANS
jgi:hypothetical protein